MQDDASPFVKSFDWLEERLERGDVRVVDASWYLPAQNRDAAAEHAAARIPGAVRFDLDQVADLASGLPHMLPSPEAFADAMGALGISDTDTIIVHDGPGFFSAPRVWWMLRIFGAASSYVLDGGFDAWKAQGRPVETGAPRAPAPARFTPRFNARAVVSLADMRKIVAGEAGGEGIQIADARGPGRFAGTEPEPRPGMRSGHMPGALNLPFQNLVDGGKLRPVNELRRVLEESGLDLARPIVTSCGSGVTAAVITLALQSVGHRHNMLYDGSWSEWGGRGDTPVATGAR